MTGNESGASDQAPQDRKPNSTNKASVARLKVPQRTRRGILNYRQQRSHAEFCRAIRDALNREARLAHHTGVNVAPDIIEDISAWVGRGCLP